MIDDQVTAWVFTVVFATLCAYSLIRVIVDHDRPLQATGHFAHAVMAADMAVMPWPLWNQIPPLLELAFFTLSTAWFGMLAFLQFRKAINPRLLGRHGAWHQLGHAVMTLAMVWMVWVMTPWREATTEASHMMGTLGILTGIAVTAALLVVTAVQAVETGACVISGERTWFGHTGDLASGTFMAAGMAAMTWLMLSH